MVSIVWLELGVASLIWSLDKGLAAVAGVVSHTGVGKLTMAMPNSSNLLT